MAGCIGANLPVVRIINISTTVTHCRLHNARQLTIKKLRLPKATKSKYCALQQFYLLLEPSFHSPEAMPSLKVIPGLKRPSTISESRLDATRSSA